MEFHIRNMLGAVAVETDHSMRAISIDLMP